MIAVPRLARISITDAVAADIAFDQRAMSVLGAKGNDINHSHQRISTIADRVGAAKYLDALNIFQGHW